MNQKKTGIYRNFLIKFSGIDPKIIQFVNTDISNKRLIEIGLSRFFKVDKVKKKQKNNKKNLIYLKNSLDFIKNYYNNLSIVKVIKNYEDIEKEVNNLKKELRDLTFNYRKIQYMEDSFHRNIATRLKVLKSGSDYLVISIPRKEYEEQQRKNEIKHNIENKPNNNNIEDKKPEDKKPKISSPSLSRRTKMESKFAGVAEIAQPSSEHRLDTQERKDVPGLKQKKIVGEQGKRDNEGRVSSGVVYKTPEIDTSKDGYDVTDTPFT